MNYIRRAGSFVALILILLWLAVWLQGCSAKHAAAELEGAEAQQALSFVSLQ